MIRKLILLLLLSIFLAGCIADKPPEKPSGILPEKGSIQITSSPPGAEVLLDNKSQGTTPVMILDLEPGNHTIELRLKGFRSLRDTIVVPPGKSHYLTTLIAEPASTPPKKTTPAATTTVARMTIKAGTDPMIIGNPEVFSGVAPGADTVTLTLYGPGSYESGMVLDRVKPNAAGLWSHTWNPGTRILSGSYTLVAGDGGKTLPASVKFMAIGNGEVTAHTRKYTVGTGEPVTFSGLCTTGAPHVRLTIFGPGRFARGIDLGLIAVTAEKTWSLRYNTDSTMPTGAYTIVASDDPKTATGTAMFTIGYASY